MSPDNLLLRTCGYVLLLTMGAGVLASVQFCMSRVSLHRESEAARRLVELGAVLTKDSSRKHVTSLSLATPKARADFAEAISLVEALPRLRSLDLSGTPVQDAHLQHLSHHSGLKALNLNDTTISDRGVVTLAKSHDLQALYLSRTPITDASAITLSQMSSLMILDLTGTTLCRDSLHYLVGLPELRSVTFDGHSLSSPATLQTYAAQEGSSEHDDALDGPPLFHVR